MSLTAALPGRTTSAPADVATGRVRPPLVGDALTTLLLGFCAIVPFTGSLALWPVMMVLVLLEVLRNRAQLGGLRISIPLFAYLAWMALSLLWSVEPSHTTSELVTNFLFVLVGTVVAVNRTLVDLLRLLVRAASILLLLCWVVTFAVPSIGRMQDTSYAGAMRGLFVEKNMLGYFSVVAFASAMIAGLSIRARMPLARRWAPAAIALSTVLGSTSKTALSVCLASVVVLVALRGLAHSRRPLGLSLFAWLGVLAGLVALLVANWTLVLSSLGRDATLTGRTKIWSVVIYAIQQRPVLGYGWKALWLQGSPTTMRLWARNYGVPFFHAHNGYLDLAAQLGLVGLVLALVLLFSILLRAMTAYLRRPTPVRAWPVLLVVVVLIYNFTEVVSFTNTTWVLLVAFASMPILERKVPTCISDMPHD